MSHLQSRVAEFSSENEALKRQLVRASTDRSAENDMRRVVDEEVRGDWLGNGPVKLKNPPYLRNLQLKKCMQFNRNFRHLDTLEITQFIPYIIIQSKFSTPRHTGNYAIYSRFVRRTWRSFRSCSKWPRLNWPWRKAWSQRQEWVSISKVLRFRNITEFSAEINLKNIAHLLLVS